MDGEALISHFGRLMLFHEVAMQKIEARRCPQKESFQEYVMDRLAIMSDLQLTPRDSIQLLII